MEPCAFSTLSGSGSGPRSVGLALFLRFARSRSKWFDSLSTNSYAIYLVHYAFVSWLQHALLPASLPALAKAVFVFGGALALSWLTAATIRRIPAVARLV